MIISGLNKDILILIYCNFEYVRRNILQISLSEGSLKLKIGSFAHLNTAARERGSYCGRVVIIIVEQLLFHGATE